MINKIATTTLLLLIYSFTSSVAQQPLGKWLEVKRISKKSGNESFSDTLKLDFSIDRFVMVRTSPSESWVGEIQTDGKKVKSKEKEFEIVWYEADSLVISMNPKIHVFKKSIGYQYDMPITKVIPGAEEGIKKQDYATLFGKWKTYKKTDPDFGKSKVYLKSLDIQDNQSSYIQSQLVLHTMDSVYTASMQMTMNEKEWIFESDSHPVIRMSLLKSDGEELILKHGSALYFLKRFGR